MKRARYVSLVLIVLLVFPTLGQGLHDSRDSLSSSPLLNSTTVPSGYFVYLPIGPLSNRSIITFESESNVSISTALMTNLQFLTFNGSQSEISNSQFYENGTDVQITLAVSAGTYYLVLYAYFADANVSYGYQVYPNSPYQFGIPSSPQPTGIASFGLFNSSGNVVPYSVSTYQVVGFANITSMQALNSTASAVNVTASRATLQLNSMIVVTDSNDSRQVYWAQDTPDFVTKASQMAYADNVWNLTDSRYFLSNQSITSQSGGYVSVANLSGITQSTYGYESSNTTYIFPLDLELAMNASSIGGQGVLLQMGLQFLKNGSSFSGTPINWFDNITIHDPNVQNVSFIVSGNDSTPVGSFYDAELVFCGEGNGESTNFTQMAASLGLFYRNNSGLVSAFPSYYSFGGDTLESADNLHVTYLGNGIAQVSVGIPNYVYLEQTVSNATSTSITGSQTIIQTNTSETSTRSGTSFSTTFTSSTASSSANNPTGNLVLNVEIAAIVVIAFAMLLVYLIHKRSQNRSTPYGP